MISLGVSPAVPHRRLGLEPDGAAPTAATSCCTGRSTPRRSSPTSAATASPTASSCPAILQTDPGPPLRGRPPTPSTLETVVYGASPISDDVLLALFDAFDCDFVQGYGLTETSGAVTMLAAEDHDRDRGPSCCGRAATRCPASSCASSIPTPASTAPTVTSARCWIRSEQVMAGYWKQPEATAEAITADGWFHSGDAGYLRDGRLYLHDRIKDMIVSGAENVYPAEVENVLMRHPDVVDVAVIGVPRRRAGARRSRRSSSARPAATVTEAETHRPRPRRPGALQVPDLGRLRRRAAPQPVGQGAQARAARAVLGRATTAASADARPRRVPPEPRAAIRRGRAGATAGSAFHETGRGYHSRSAHGRPEWTPLILGEPEPVEHRERDCRVNAERRMTAVHLDVLGERADLVDARLPRRDAVASWSTRTWPAPSASVALARRSD